MPGCKAPVWTEARSCQFLTRPDFASPGIAFKCKQKVNPEGVKRPDDGPQMLTRSVMTPGDDPWFPTNGQWHKTSHISAARVDWGIWQSSPVSDRSNRWPLFTKNPVIRGWGIESLDHFSQQFYPCRAIRLAAYFPASKLFWRVGDRVHILRVLRESPTAAARWGFLAP